MSKNCGQMTCLLLFAKVKVLRISKVVVPQDSILWGDLPYAAKVSKVAKLYDGGLPYDSEELFWSLCRLIERYEVDHCSVSASIYRCQENLFALLQAMYPGFKLNVVGRSATSPAR